MASENDESAVSIYSARKRFAEESVADVKAQTERRYNSIAHAENAERVVKLNVGGAVSYTHLTLPTNREV